MASMAGPFAAGPGWFVLATEARPVDASSAATAAVSAASSAVAYLTGASTLEAQGEYAGRASFFDLLHQRLKTGIPAGVTSRR